MPETHDELTNELFNILKKELGNDPELEQTLSDTPVLTYKIDFKKVSSLEELLKILNHLNFVISGPQEYFDTYFIEIKDYLVQVEEVEQGS